MWFKNLQLYRLPAPWPVDLAKFGEQLAEAIGAWNKAGRLEETTA